MILRLLLALLLLVPGRALWAQDVATANAAIAALAAAGREYRAVDAAFTPASGGAQRRALRERAQAVSATATANVEALGAQIALVDARIAQLGPATPGVTEAPDIQAQRRRLAGTRATLDSAVKRGRLLTVEADQLATEIGDSAADAFNQRVSARTPSPLTPRFWRLFLDGLPRDGDRVGRILAAETRAIADGLGKGPRWPAVLGLVCALALLVPGRIATQRFGRTLMIERAPGSRLRRSGFALWIALSGTLAYGVAAIVLVEGLGASGMIASSWGRLADTLVRVAFVAGAFVALGEALLQPDLPSWRLPPVGDRAATALRRWARTAAAVVFASATATEFMGEVGSGAPLTIAAEGLCALVQLGVVLGTLRTIGILRAAAEADAEADDGTPPRRAGGAAVGFVALIAWGTALFAVLALLSGYFMLALTISRLMLWLPLVVAALYLLLIAADDLCTGLVSRDSRLGTTLVHGFGLRASLVDQAGVFLSALIRLLLLALAFSVATGPFGSNVGSLFGIAAAFAKGLTIGEITISPGAIVRAVLVLAVGLFVVRAVQRWLTERYLPATELDAGARNSIAMVARYTGLILAMLWALASLGIGVERIALLLSALSVGIGFGLQAITQNFVSGLILLAERPVKIGDWVRIGNDEGDVKRISVRATEIEIADKSTLIVPNSELITKAVLNRTLADPIGRIQLQFSLPLGADVGGARDRLLAIYRDTAGVLEEPAPSVFIDAIADGRIALNSFAYVRSPRATYGTRSEILFRLLRELPAAGIELGTAPQQMQIISDGGAAPAPPPAEPKPA